MALEQAFTSKQTGDCPNGYRRIAIFSVNAYNSKVPQIHAVVHGYKDKAKREEEMAAGKESGNYDCSYAIDTGTCIVFTPEEALEIYHDTEVGMMAKAYEIVKRRPEFEGAKDI